jgi:hypothetical protein
MDGDQVRLYQWVRRAWRHEDLHAAPPRELTDAMRDVETLINGASAASNPRWADAGQDRPSGETAESQWREAAFGDLTATAQQRRDALARPGARNGDRRPGGAG